MDEVVFPGITIPEEVGGLVLLGSADGFGLEVEARLSV